MGEWEEAQPLTHKALVDLNQAHGEIAEESPKIEYRRLDEALRDEQRIRGLPPMLNREQRRGRAGGRR